MYIRVPVSFTAKTAKRVLQGVLHEPTNIKNTQSSFIATGEVGSFSKSISCKSHIVRWSLLQRNGKHFQPKLVEDGFVGK